MTLGFTGLQLLILKKRRLPSEGTIIIPLNWKLRVSLSYVDHSSWLWINKEGSYCTAWGNRSWLSRENGLQLHRVGKEEPAWNTGGPQWDVSVLPCPVIQVSGKLQQPNAGKTPNGPDPSRTKVGSPQQARNHHLLRCSLRANGIWNGVLEGH